MWVNRKEKIRKNKLCFKVLNKYSHILLACAKQVMKTFALIPITYLDLFNASIEKFVNLYEQFDPNLGVPLESYLVHKIKLFMLGYATSFTTKNYQINNFSVSLDELTETIQFAADCDFEQYEIQDIYSRITDPLDEVEQEMFQMFFLQDLPTKDIAKKVGITTQKVNDFVRLTSNKLRNFF
ncbi:sigma-70 family RNA polymerase sigma factor [Mesomycoplasma dispar]|uniref:RNA polymerase n=1 Tax=Mesomycoplasma dispar TaxID=86660 RepID=A0ABN5DRV6_9BACT|nr:sigma-70 family RNA polymerase sigma factor [Mesomycoplasma dispar]ATP59998.1 RNA polymerase [Mesomycoplasma dispar]